MILEFKVVAKFLCNRGILADKIINFQNPHTLSRVREPDNKYDPKAILIKVSQESNLLKEPPSHENEKTELVLGYVPKDLAYNLSTIVDSDHVF